ncbi:hypothetical protein ACFVAJ_11200 [Agromyces sp. NPDC057679]|uniref:hypothetical protein n=1 Tax=Agromyces sp. NPDC057679 TaxID=3346207 RepID=UPI00366B9D32
MDLDGRVLWGKNSEQIEVAAADALELFAFDEALGRLRRRFSPIYHQNSVNGVRRG